MLTCPSCRPRVQVGCRVSSRTLTRGRHPIYPSASLGTAVGGQTQWSPADSNRSSHLRDLSASLSPLTLPSSFSFSTFSFFILFLNPLISIFISTSHGSVSIYVLPCFPAKVNLNCDTGVSGADFFNLNSNEELSLSLLQSTCLIAA